MNRYTKITLLLLSQVVVASFYVSAFGMPPELADKIDECTSWQVEDLTISDEEFEKRMEIDCVDYAKYSDANTIQEYAQQQHPSWWGNGDDSVSSSEEDRTQRGTQNDRGDVRDR